jgi:hypothetical protein
MRNGIVSRRSIAKFLLEIIMSYKDRDIYGIYKKNYNEQEDPEPRLMGADMLIGEDVYNQDEGLGDIEEME